LWEQKGKVRRSPFLALLLTHRVPLLHGFMLCCVIGQVYSRLFHRNSFNLHANLFISSAEWRPLDALQRSVPHGCHEAATGGVRSDPSPSSSFSRPTVICFAYYIGRL
jgi:hypothetical protein